MKRRLPILLLLTASVLGIAGCSLEGDHSDIKDELSGIVGDVKGKVEPLPPLIAYLPFPYNVQQFADPFSPSKAQTALKPANPGQNAPDQTRAREPLEAFPLESMSMIGTLSQGGHTYALVKTERGVYRVAPNNFMGQNYGKVLAVNEGEIEIRELVQDGSGEWTVRIVTMPLTEAPAPGAKK